MPTPFEVLGIEPDADETTVLDAYRRRVKETHPDHGGSLDEFQAVREAYHELQGGPDWDAGGSTADHPAGAPPTNATVEYLNYEVLDDFGWALDTEDLFERAAAADLDARDYGRFEVEPDESLLEAAERCGFAWPYACRGGACANCAVSMCSGDLAQPVSHVLPGEMLDRDIRLSCNGIPLDGDLQVVYNVKELPDLAELRLPPYPFEKAYSGV